VLAAKNVT